MAGAATVSRGMQPAYNKRTLFPAIYWSSSLANLPGSQVTKGPFDMAHRGQHPKKKAERMVSELGANQRSSTVRQLLIYRHGTNVCFLRVSLFFNMAKHLELKVVLHALRCPDPSPLPAPPQSISGNEASPELGLATSCLVPPSALLSLNHFPQHWTPPFFLPFSQISMNSRDSVYIRLLTEEWGQREITTAQHKEQLQTLF